MRSLFAMGVLALAVFVVPVMPVRAQDWREQVVAALGNGGMYVEDHTGRPLLTHRIDDHFVPASTIKIATAACVLKRLGPDFRFVTDFYLTDRRQLVIKGYGDPMLVSEEFARIAKALKQQGILSVTDIVVDAAYFAPGIVIDGVERSANPYDALNSAVLANFNTVHVRKLRHGQVESAEAQTPITPTAAAMARRLPAGTHRINLAVDAHKATRYVGELLAAFLAKEGIGVSGEVRGGTVPAGARPIYRHQSSRSLKEIVRGLLEFSTNLTSNQLFLVLGARQFGPPATVAKGVRVLTEFLRDDVGWRNFQIAEGSGLSRKTQVTPRQMMQLLRYFAPYRDLLPIKDQVFQAKTGTLIGANTYAGYFPLTSGGHARFVILVNDGVPYEHKFRIAKMIYAGVNAQ